MIESHLTNGGKTDDKEADSIINRAIEKGINLVDTANVYGYGRSEEVVGKALKTNGKRNEIILATSGMSFPARPCG